MSKIRHLRIATAALLLAVCGALPPLRPALAEDVPSAGEETYLFFEEGEARCEIALPARPQPEEQDAALLLQDVFGALGGVAVPVVTNPPGAATGPQCAQMPSFASRNHSGHSYCFNDSSVG